MKLRKRKACSGQKAVISESLDNFVVETDGLSSKYWSPMKRVTYIHTLIQPAALLWDRRGVGVGSFAPDQP